MDEGYSENIRLWWWCCVVSGGGGGGAGVLVFKKAEIFDSARESYSSSPQLEDCILPLLHESMREKEREQKMEKA